MNNSPSQLLDLPDELLVIILKNFNNVLALYSFMGINRRFDQILQDPMIINRLTFITSYSTNPSYSISSTIINCFYYNILHLIHHQIQ